MADEACDFIEFVIVWTAFLILLSISVFGMFLSAQSGYRYIKRKLMARGGNDNAE